MAGAGGGGRRDAAHHDRRDRLRRGCATPRDCTRCSPGAACPRNCCRPGRRADAGRSSTSPVPRPVLFHQNAGVLDPDRAVAALLRLATANGADVRFDTQVTGLAAGGDGAVVRAGEESFTAPGGRRRGGRLDRAAARRPRRPAAAHRHQAARSSTSRRRGSHRAGVASRGRPRRQPTAAEPWPAFIVHDEADFCYGLPGGRDGEVPGAIKVGEHRPGPGHHRGGPRLPRRRGRQGPGGRLRRAGGCPASTRPR